MLKSVTGIGMATTLLFTAIHVNAFDEYLPVPERRFQVDLGFARGSIMGEYSKQGDLVGEESLYDPIAFPIQGKFGLMNGLDAEAEINFEQIAGDTAGFSRPILTLKYAHPGYGAGGFLSVTLPFGFEDIVSSDPHATLTFGGLYVQKFTFFSLYANGAYDFNTENVNMGKRDELRLFLRGGYVVDHPKLKKSHLEPYLAVKQQWFFNEKGKSVDGPDFEPGMLTTLTPGILYRATNLIGFEVMVPFTVAGESQPASQFLIGKLKLYLDL